jgi:hypothetical protein
MPHTKWKKVDNSRQEDAPATKANFSDALTGQEARFKDLQRFSKE